MHNPYTSVHRSARATYSSQSNSSSREAARAHSPIHISIHTCTHFAPAIGVHTLSSHLPPQEREGDLVFAVRLFLKGGLPARAAAVVQRYEDRSQFQPALLETVAAALFEYGEKQESCSGEAK